MRCFVKSVTTIFLVALIIFGIIISRQESPGQARDSLIRLAASQGACTLSVGNAQVPLSQGQVEGLLRILRSEPDVRPLAEDPGPVAWGAVNIKGGGEVRLYDTSLVWHHREKAFFWPTNQTAGISQLVYDMHGRDDMKTAKAVAAMLQR
jgi:hypothetical protein